jgi:PmbA protein
MIGRERSLEIARQALRSLPGEQAEVMLFAEDSALTRYWNSTIHQNIQRHDLLISVRVIADGGVGQAYTSSVGPDALRLAGQHALQIARARRGTGQFQFSPGGEVASLPTYFDATAACGPDQRAAAVGLMAAVAARAGLVIHGSFLIEQSEMAVVNTTGAEQYALFTIAGIRVAAASAAGDTGFAEGISRDVTQLQAEELAQRATGKCRLNRQRQSLPPGEYVTILEEIAVADLVRFLGTLGLNGQAVLEGRSFATGHLGEQLVDPRITLRDDPWDPRGLPMPFDPEGTPKRPLTLIDRGVIRQVVYDNFTAAQTGTHSTGHGAPPDPEAMMDYPAPTNMFLEGGDTSLEEMIASTERGVLVTSLHYTNSPDPRRVVVTGMTRDGTYLVENGQITRALHNQRIQQSVLEMLNNVIAIGRKLQLHRDWWGGGGISMQHGVIGACAHHVPALKVGRFRFIGESPVV